MERNNTVPKHSNQRWIISPNALAKIPFNTSLMQSSISAPCEETTRIKFGAVSQPKAVDSSPSRRLDVALRNLSKGCASATAKSTRTLTQGIISELNKAAAGDVASFAVGKKDEIERIAASAR